MLIQFTISGLGKPNTTLVLRRTKAQDPKDRTVRHAQMRVCGLCWGPRCSAFLLCSDVTLLPQPRCSTPAVFFRKVECMTLTCRLLVSTEQKLRCWFIGQTGPCRQRQCSCLCCSSVTSSWKSHVRCVSFLLIFEPCEVEYLSYCLEKVCSALHG